MWLTVGSLGIGRKIIFDAVEMQIELGQCDMAFVEKQVVEIPRQDNQIPNSVFYLHKRRIEWITNYSSDLYINNDASRLLNTSDCALACDCCCFFACNSPIISEFVILLGRMQLQNYFYYSSINGIVSSCLFSGHVMRSVLPVSSIMLLTFDRRP